MSRDDIRYAVMLTGVLGMLAGVHFASMPVIIVAGLITIAAAGWP